MFYSEVKTGRKYDVNLLINSMNQMNFQDLSELANLIQKDKMHLFVATEANIIYYTYYINSSAEPDMKALSRALEINPIRVINGSEIIADYPILCKYLKENQDAVFLGVSLVEWKNCRNRKFPLYVRCVSFGM